MLCFLGYYIMLPKKTIHSLASNLFTGSFQLISFLFPLKSPVSFYTPFRLEQIIEIFGSPNSDSKSAKVG